jgi:hypothetical protein
MLELARCDIGRYMEGNEISIQEAQTFNAFQKCTAWITSKDLIKQLSDGPAPRSVRHYLAKFVKLGLADVMELWPGHRYRLSDKADKRNTAYFQRLTQAIDAFGLH